jgi:hypothetical protein
MLFLESTPPPNTEVLKQFSINVLILSGVEEFGVRSFSSIVAFDLVVSLNKFFSFRRNTESNPMLLSVVVSLTLFPLQEKITTTRVVDINKRKALSSVMILLLK